MYKCGALSYFSKVSFLWGMSLVLFQMLSTFPTRFVESPSLLDAESQNCLRWGIVKQCFRNLFTPKGTNFSVLSLVWSFPFSHLDFYVLHPILGLWMAKSSMPLFSNQYIRVCWLKSNNFRALAEGGAF